MKKKINEILTDVTKKLLPQCLNEQTAQAESWWLLEQLTKKTKTELIQQDELVLSAQDWNTLTSWTTERVEQNKPLQYIIGTVPFLDLEIIVEPPILIPRPETEEWVAWLIEKLEPLKDKHGSQPAIKILDIGVGSGCIALALARAFPYATIIGVDANNTAVALSKKNKTHNKINNAIFLQSNLYQELSQHKNSFDLIVSNPPYISYTEYKNLSREVLDWEDKNALVASDDGFAIHKKILDDAKHYLKHDDALLSPDLPRIVLECGKGQHETLQKSFAQADFKNIEIHQDLETVPRWLTGTI